MSYVNLLANAFQPVNKPTKLPINAPPAVVNGSGLIAPIAVPTRVFVFHVASPVKAASGIDDPYCPTKYEPASIRPTPSAS